LLPDEIIRPVRGQATIFAATPGVQEMFHADLTMFWQRKDWQRRLKKAEPKTPLEPLDPLPLRLCSPRLRSGQAGQAVRREVEPSEPEEPEPPFDTLRTQAKGGQEQDMEIDELPGWPDWDDR